MSVLRRPGGPIASLRCAAPMDGVQNGTYIIFGVARVCAMVVHWAWVCLCDISLTQLTSGCIDGGGDAVC